MHVQMQDDSIDTARTDYSDLEDHSLPKVLVEKDPIPAMDGVDQQQWEKALEEANQQHQWAMQVSLVEVDCPLVFAIQACQKRNQEHSGHMTIGREMHFRLGNISSFNHGF